MELKEVILTLNEKKLNEKTNHYIFTDIKNKEIHQIVKEIKPICTLRHPSLEVLHEIGRTDIPNMVVDVSAVKVEDLLNETLSFLNISESIPFLDKKSLMRFRGILRNYNKVVQWIILNGDILNFQEQQKMNEIFWFNTYFFNINYLLTTSNLTTYCLKVHIFL